MANYVFKDKERTKIVYANDCLRDPRGIRYSGKKIGKESYLKIEVWKDKIGISFLTKNVIIKCKNSMRMNREGEYCEILI